jgi:hypothetical protein
MKQSRFTRTLMGLWLAVGLLGVPLMAAAQSYNPVTSGIVPECARRSGTFGDAPAVPQLSCAMELFGNIALLVLGITGSLALLMFVYGGFTMVIAGGDSGRYQKGKTILKNAIVGIVIIMTSGLMLRYAVGILAANNSKFQIIGQPCNNGAGTYVQSKTGAIICTANK